MRKTSHYFVYKHNQFALFKYCILRYNRDSQSQDCNYTLTLYPAGAHYCTQSLLWQTKKNGAIDFTHPTIINLKKQVTQKNSYIVLYICQPSHKVSAFLLKTLIFPNKHPPGMGSHCEEMEILSSSCYRPHGVQFKLCLIYKNQY